MPIPAGETVDFDSGTLHLMLANLTEDNRADDVFDLTIVFARTGKVTLQVPVRSGAEPMDGEPQSERVEVGNLVLEGVWSRPAPSFASASAAGTHGKRAVRAESHHTLDVVELYDSAWRNSRR